MTTRVPSARALGPPGVCLFAGGGCFDGAPPPYLVKGARFDPGDEGPRCRWVVAVAAAVDEQLVGAVVHDVVRRGEVLRGAVGEALVAGSDRAGEGRAVIQVGGVGVVNLEGGDGRGPRRGGLGRDARLLTGNQVRITH